MVELWWIFDGIPWALCRLMVDLGSGYGGIRLDLWWICGGVIGSICGGFMVELWLIYERLMVGLWWNNCWFMVDLWWIYSGIRVEVWWF